MYYIKSKRFSKGVFEILLFSYLIMMDYYNSSLATETHAGFLYKKR